MNNAEEQAVEYLKNKSEYKRIMKAIKEKYKKTGKITGKVTLSNITKEEGLILGSIDVSLFEAKEGSFSIKKFINSFSVGKFEGIDFLNVLKSYFGEEEIKTNREVKHEKILIKDTFFVNLLSIIKSEEVKLWIHAMLDFKKYGYASILRIYNENPNELKNILLNIDKSFDIINFQSKEYMPLAKFSSIVTKDSHYFDIDNLPGKLFISALGYLYNIRTDNVEGKNEALMKVNLIRDEISNFTITYGLMVYDKNEEIQGYKWFRREREPLLLNIYNLNSIELIKSIYNKVYVFENPTVFYELLKKTKDIPITLICTSGQLNVSSMILLDKLKDSGSIIYYSGDFDPEGLQIANKLKNRYKDKLKFLGMNVKNYLKIKGNNSFKERVGKLNAIDCSELEPLVNEMKKHCTAGYQELLIDYYYDFIVRTHEEK